MERSMEKNMEKSMEAMVKTSPAYRTRRRSDATHKTYPSRIASITDPNYQYGLSTCARNKAFMVQVEDGDGLAFKDGRLFYYDRPVTLSLLNSIRSDDGFGGGRHDRPDYSDDNPAGSLNLPLLRALYSIITGGEFLDSSDSSRRWLDRCLYGARNEDGICTALDTEDTETSDAITLYLPDFEDFIGNTRNLSHKSIEALISNIRSLQSLVGIIESDKAGDKHSAGRSLYKILPVIILHSYNTKANTLKVSSPYMSELYKTVQAESVMKNRKGGTIKKKDGTPVHRASHSYLIKPSIVSQKCRAAVENVFLIISLIEQAGMPKRGSRTMTAHIRMVELISRNPVLVSRLEHAKSNSDRSKILSRVFTKTYELLKRETCLTDSYKDLEIKEIVPKVSTVESDVFEIRHKGSR